MNDVLIVSADGPVHRWTLNRPKERNALNRALVDALLRAAEATARDSSCRAVLLSGTPPVFCAGSDVAEFSGREIEAIAQHQSRWPELRHALRALEIPVVAKITGGAFGGGLFLATYADYRLADERSIFSAPEVALGWLPPGGIEELIVAVGVARARQLVLTGARIRARRALEIGLVDEVIPPQRLDAAAEHILSYLARLPRESVASVKRYFGQRSGLNERERDELQLAEFEKDLKTSAARESIDRFRRAGNGNSAEPRSV